MRSILARFPLLRPLRPLHWFVLGWVMFLALFYIVPIQPAFIVLILAHLLLYLFTFAGQVPQRWHWLVLLVQAGLVFVLAYIEHDVMTFFALSLSWSIVALASFNSVRARLIAMGSYVLFFSLGIFLLHQMFRSFFASVYPIKYIFVLTVFFAPLSLIFYLQQQHAYRQTQELLRNLNAAHAQLSAYALRVEELTTLAERQRLARELHDTLSQGIVGLLMQLDAAHAHFEKNLYPQGCTIVTQAIERARTMLTETRYVISDLRTPNSLHPDDLPELAQEEIERFTNATGIPCQVDLDPLAFTPAAYCEQVLRVITEGLTNIARHANARQVWVCATTDAEWLEIEVRDDGTGFDPATIVNVPGHYGLIGLRERARVMGGHLDITSAIGKGTTIRLHVPCESRHAGIAEKMYASTSDEEERQV